jgi:hypothetical protein
MTEDLSKSDKNRIKNCEYYLRSKQIMKNAEAYKGLSLGEVYYIKYKDYGGDESYITAGYGNEPAKYIVFHKDEGFVFVKRIISNGKLGKEVTCLTTTYNAGEYWLEADPDYVNSILLEDEGGYDPLAASKKLSSNKNKARRRNKKLEIAYGTHKEAHEYAKTIKVGDLIYNAETTYGSDLVSWEVTSIEKRPADQIRNGTNSYYGTSLGSTNADRIHNRHGIKDLIAVEIKVKGEIPKSRKYMGTEQILTFEDFLWTTYDKFYRTKPYTVDDV